MANVPPVPKPDDAVPARVRPVYRSGVSTRRQIVESATRLFAARGFHGTTVNDVADLAQVSGPSLFYHFNSKTQLLAASFLQLHDSLVERERERLSEETSPASRLDVLISTGVDFMWQHRRELGVLVSEDRHLEPADRDAAHARREVRYQIWAEVIEGVRPDLSEVQSRSLAIAAIFSLYSLVLASDDDRLDPADRMRLLSGAVHAMVIGANPVSPNNALAASPTHPPPKEEQP